MFLNNIYNVDNVEEAVERTFQNSKISTKYIMLKNKNTNSSNTVIGFNRVSCTKSSAYEVGKATPIQSESNIKYYAKSLVVLPNECMQYSTPESLNSPSKESSIKSSKKKTKRCKPLVHSETFTMNNPSASRVKTSDLKPSEVVDYESNSNDRAGCDKKKRKLKNREDKNVDTSDLSSCFKQSTKSSQIPVKLDKTFNPINKCNRKAQSSFNLTEHNRVIENRCTDASQIRNVLDVVAEYVNNADRDAINENEVNNEFKNVISLLGKTNQAKSYNKLTESKTSLYNPINNKKKANVKGFNKQKGYQPIKADKFKLLDQKNNFNDISKKINGLRSHALESPFYNMYGERMSMRVFSVSPFDEIIKSHLSTFDRRLKAISTKVDCSIKIAGPIVNYSSTNINHSNRKTRYLVYLVGEAKEMVDKCCKCLHDSFPSMKLDEIVIPKKLNV